jgi:hypothetical protein
MIEQFSAEIYCRWKKPGTACTSCDEGNGALLPPAASFHLKLGQIYRAFEKQTRNLEEKRRRAGMKFSASNVENSLG